MGYPNLWSLHDLSRFFDSYLADFILGFAFFTAVIYAVLGRRFGHQRAAITMSAAMGVALALGLVWWENANGISIRDLGPIAVGFALIILASVMFQGIKHVGGSWSGAAITFGATILIGTLVGIDWPINPQVFHSMTVVALTVGIMAFLLHRRGVWHPMPRRQELDDIRHDATDLYDDRSNAGRLGRGLQRVRDEARSLHEHPERVGDVMLQLQRILPAEGWITERLAWLREKAVRIKRGHIMQIEELQGQIGRLTVTERRKAASRLAALYRELKLDGRIERLDKAAAALERRVRELTRQAQLLNSQQKHKELVGVLDEATKLQDQIARLLKTISRTEERLLSAATRAARKSPEARSG